jgi:hypothetical protein
MAMRSKFLRFICVAGFLLFLYPTINVNGSELKQGMNTGIGGFSQVLDHYYTNLHESTKKDTKMENNTELQSQELTGLDITEFACRFIGNPYVWGGTSLVNGTDCSGFVQSVYKHFGISLERVSREQAQTAGQEVEVSLKTLQPGDLLFYARGGTVHHVAIYIGNGKVVHAAGKKYGIIISDYDYKDVYKARRVIVGQATSLGFHNPDSLVKLSS